MMMLRGIYWAPHRLLYVVVTTRKVIICFLFSISNSKFICFPQTAANAEEHVRKEVVPMTPFLIFCGK